MVPVDEISPMIFRSDDRIERLLLLTLPPVGRVGRGSGVGGLGKHAKSLGAKELVAPIRTEGALRVKPWTCRRCRETAMRVVVRLTSAEGFDHMGQENRPEGGGSI